MNGSGRPSRRQFLRTAAGAATGLGLASLGLSCSSAAQRAASAELFKISLAQWSFHNALFGRALPHLANLDFAAKAREFGIDGIDYVNQFFKDKAEDIAYLDEMKKRASGEGVRSLLIMCDGEGNLGDPDDAARTKAVHNHHRWVRAAEHLGCHSIRVNARSKGSYDEQMKLAADGLARLTAYGDEHGINVIVENHGGLSSNGVWLSAVMKRVDHPRCGTLPDFGNFGSYDRYKGVAALMPWARSVSAKTHDFDEAGNETHTDYLRMMKIVVDSGYHGWVGIEYEGRGLSEAEGVAKTKRLLERVRKALA